MFLLVSVILLTRGISGRENPPWQVDPPARRPPWQGEPPGRETPLERSPPAYGQWAAGTHPTGMHSCSGWAITQDLSVLSDRCHIYKELSQIKFYKWCDTTVNIWCIKKRWCWLWSARPEKMIIAILMLGCWLINGSLISKPVNWKPHNYGQTVRIYH